MRGLYAIVDWDFCQNRGIDVRACLRGVIAGGPAVVQVRAKSADDKLTLELLKLAQAARRELSERAQASACPLIFANDRPDLALLAECDGVHVGQDDLSIDQVRRFAPRLQVGISTHSREQLVLALKESPSYVAYGPVFATQSKQNPDPVVGISGLAEAHALTQAAGIPLVGIGGIGTAQLAAVLAHLEMPAMISELVPPDASQTHVAAHVLELARRCRES